MRIFNLCLMCWQLRFWYILWFIFHEVAKALLLDWAFLRAFNILWFLLILLSKPSEFSILIIGNNRTVHLFFIYTVECFEIVAWVFFIFLRSWLLFFLIFWWFDFRYLILCLIILMEISLLIMLSLLIFNIKIAWNNWIINFIWLEIIKIIKAWDIVLIIGFILNRNFIFILLSL